MRDWDGAIATTDPLQGSIALAIGRGANQWREGWWSFPPEWYGVFVGDLKWVKTVLFFGERAYEVLIHECE